MFFSALFQSCNNLGEKYLECQITRARAELIRAETERNRQALNWYLALAATGFVGYAGYTHHRHIHIQPPPINYQCTKDADDIKNPPHYHGGRLLDDSSNSNIYCDNDLYKYQYCCDELQDTFSYTDCYEGFTDEDVDYPPNFDICKHLSGGCGRH